MNITQTTEVNRIRIVQLSNEDIIKMLRKEGVIRDNETIKSIHIEVPGGGDWSNMNLDINDKDPIQVVLHSSPEFPLIKLVNKFQI